MTLTEAYEQAHMERMALLRALQNPHLEPRQTFEIIQRLESADTWLNFCIKLMNEQYKIH